MNEQALQDVFKLQPVAQLLSGAFTTVWLEPGDRIRVRESTTSEVHNFGPTPNPTATQLVRLLQQALNGAVKGDITVNGHEFLVSQIEVVGGLEFVIAHRSRAPQAAFVSTISIAV